MRNFAHVTNYLTKLEQVATTQSDPMCALYITQAT